MGEYVKLPIGIESFQEIRTELQGVVNYRPSLSMKHLPENLTKMTTIKETKYIIMQYRIRSV